MSIIKNNLTLSKYSTGTNIPGTFSQVEVTSDGRCFFGSVWLGSLVDNVDQIAALQPRIDKFNIKTQNNELNTWMQDNLINRLDSVQQTCRFVYYVWSYQRQVKFRVEDSTLEDIIPSRFVDMCVSFPNSHYVKEKLPKILKNNTYLRYKNEFVTFYKSLNILNRSSYEYAEPDVGLAQELANSLGQNITIVNPSGVINEKIYWVNMKENDKKMIYVCKLDAAHYQALIPETTEKPHAFLRSPSPAAKTALAGVMADSLKSEEARVASLKSKEDAAIKEKEDADYAAGIAASLEEAARVKRKEEADLAAALANSRKEEEAKRKEDEDYAAALANSRKEEEAKRKEDADASLKTPVPTKTTTIPTPTLTPAVVPINCPVPKTNIPIYYVVFRGPNRLGDYNYMIKQPEYKNTLFIFNDNEKDHYTWDKGSGNAEIRPYNYYGWKKLGLTKPLSAGIPTGDDKGYTQLDKDTLFQINKAINDIGTIVETFKSYDQIIYSGTNNQIPQFKSDPEDLIGIGKYEVSKKVREYITQQIKCLGDFKGRLKPATPLKDIQNVAIMLFVNNSTKVVFVRNFKTKKWMLPGGRIDNKETPWQAAAREYQEETGNKLPSNLQEKDFDYYDQLHSKGEFTRIFIGKTDVKSPPYNIAKVKNNETDKLECRLLSDVLSNKTNYSAVILNSTQAIYDKINKEGEYSGYSNREIAPQSTTTSVSTSSKTAPQSTTTSTSLKPAPQSTSTSVSTSLKPASQSTTTTPAPVSKKNVTFSSNPEFKANKDNFQYVKEPFPKKLTTNNNRNNYNNIAERNQYFSTRNKIQNGYVMAANSIEKYNNAPFTSNPKQHIAIGTGAGLALLAGLTFVGGKKNLTRKIKNKNKNKNKSRTRKHSRKTQRSNKRRKGNPYNKTHKKRK